MIVTNAYFENIQTVIKEELLQAKRSVYMGVAWCTDSVLFETLFGVTKVKRLYFLPLLVFFVAAPFDNVLCRCWGVPGSRAIAACCHLQLVAWAYTNMILACLSCATVVGQKTQQRLIHSTLLLP